MIIFQKIYCWVYEGDSDLLTCEELIETIFNSQGGLHCQINNETGYITCLVESLGEQSRVKFEHPGITNTGPFLLTEALPDELVHLVLA